MSKINKKALIVGETRSCIDCAEYLIKHGWSVIAILSNDKEVINWAWKNSIFVLLIDNADNIAITDFYLFSISSPYVVPESFLIKKRVILAITYHKSLLPRYYGIDPVTWAIINNEKQHGISLFRISSSLEVMDIAIQAPITIDDNETASSLKLKCNKRLLTLFKELISKIDENSLTFTRQETDKSTYHGIETLPKNFGVINGITDLAEIDRLDRGLTFADNEINEIASVKILLNDKFYILEGFNRKLLDIQNKIPNANLDQNAILFNTVRDILGNKVDLKVKVKDLVGDKFELSKEEESVLVLARYNEHMTTTDKALAATIEQIPMVVLEEIPSSLQSQVLAAGYEEKIKLPQNIDWSISLMIIYITLTMSFDERFLITLYADEITVPERLRALIESKNFVPIEKDCLKSPPIYLHQFICQIVGTTNFNMKDFYYRYNLNYLISDIALVMGKVRPLNQHKLVITYDESGIKVEGNIYHKLKIVSIAKHIKTLVDKFMTGKFVDPDLTRFTFLDETEQSLNSYDNIVSGKEFSYEDTIRNFLKMYKK